MSWVESAEEQLRRQEASQIRLKGRDAVDDYVPLCVLDKDEAVWIRPASFDEEDKWRVTIVR